MTDVSTVVGPHGNVHTIKVVRAKRRMNGRVAGGALFPKTLPAIPSETTEEWNDPMSPEIVQEDGTRRCLRIGVWSQGDMHDQAVDYAATGGSTRLLPEIERERVDAIRQHALLPGEITTVDGETMPKSRWLNQGLVFSKPPAITDDQRFQLLAAAYWAHTATDPATARDAQAILAYYSEMGYRIELKRPYRRRN